MQSGRTVGAEVAIRVSENRRCFSTKAEAIAWATARESEIRAGKGTGIQAGRTVGDAYDSYEKEVSATKRGQRFEVLRLPVIGAWQINEKPFRDMRLADATSETPSKWRDYRINTDRVTGSTVNRELNLLSNATAAKEWKLIAASPTMNVLRPRESEPRDRLYTDDEIQRICFARGFDLGSEERVETASQRIAVAYLFAIETAMRASEICSLLPEYISGRTITLPPTITKNGTKLAIPLSKRAPELLESLPQSEKGRTVFRLTAKSLDALFRKAGARAAIDDAAFHKTRHLAITRLAKKLNVLDLAQMVGHRDLKQLQVYYSETTEPWRPN